MASRGGTSSIFHNASSPNIKPNKSFSIKSILDLPEESAEENAQSSSNSSSVESCSVSRLPLVPRAVRPMVHHHADNVPPSGPMNWQDFGVAPLVHHWSYGAFPFRNQDFPFGRIFPKKRRRPMRKKKQRPLFSPHQIQTMEKEFAKQRYISENNRARLALEIKLTEAQVKTWFQNRRTKWKKETKDEASTEPRCSQLGEMNQVLLAVSGTNSFYQNICVDSLVNPFGALPQYCTAPLFSTFDLKGSFVA